MPEPGHADAAARHLDSRAQAVHDALALPQGSAVVVDAPADHSLRPEFTGGHRNHLRHGRAELPAGPPG
ncbi:hypothetical protein ACIGXI_01180 [Kitasatospora aureofaciens]|uniref:hypothetical protein n=1 Tax=Kitasatospora aureofaciens TaxID=1894 RepID=UPI0037C7E0A0